MAEAGTSLSARVGWCLYDWAISAFFTVILTFVFFAYFDAAVVGTESQTGDTTRSTVLWGHMTALAGLVIALSSPLVGAIADRSGRRKPWLLVMTVLTVLLTAGLWFIAPDPAYIYPALILVGLAIICAELSSVFYNAMLPALVPEEKIGRLSGWGWGVGYLGGIAVMIIALMVFITAEGRIFGLDIAKQEHIRGIFLLTALWICLFSLPLFLFTPDAHRLGEARKTPLRQAIREGVIQLWNSFRAVRHYANLVRFFIASAIYRDGLATLFAFGAVYAATVMQMTPEEIIRLGILMNVSAGIGALLFAWVDDWLGAKPTIIISLIGMIILGMPILLIQDKAIFIWAALPMVAFVGPIQAASRSLLARIAPVQMTTESFGLYALTGKAIAFLGPLTFATLTQIWGTQRAGMAGIFLFLTLGLILLLGVRVPPRKSVATPDLVKASLV